MASLDLGPMQATCCCVILGECSAKVLGLHAMACIHVSG